MVAVAAAVAAVASCEVVGEGRKHNEFGKAKGRRAWQGAASSSSSSSSWQGDACVASGLLQTAPEVGEQSPAAAL